MTDDLFVDPAPKPGQRGFKMSDAQKLKMAEGRHRAAEQRQREKAERQAKQVEYFDVVGGTPEERAKQAPRLDDIVGKAVAAATATGGSNAAEIAATVGATITALLPALLPAPQAAAGQAKPVPPHVQQARDEAGIQLRALITDFERRNAEVPQYRLAEDFYDGWQLHPTNTKIAWGGCPNAQMMPLNEPARQLYALYMESIGGSTLDIGDVTYEAHRHRPRYGDDQPVAAGEVYGRRRGPGDKGQAVALEDEPGEAPVRVRPPPFTGGKKTETPGSD